MNRSQYVAMYKRLERTRTRYTECLRLERKDGTVYRFTAHDNDIWVWESDGGRYSYTPAHSFELTALESNAGLAVSNMDIEGIVSDDSITEEDILSGKFEHAKVELFIAYWSNSQVGTLPLRVSWIGELKLQEASFRAELRGIAQKLAQSFVEAASLECRYMFCDRGFPRSHCGLDAANYTNSFTVSAVRSNSVIEVNLNSAYYDKYKWGLVRFTSGALTGVEMEVINQFQTKLTLFLPLPRLPSVGDSVDILEGCDKTYTSCKDRFGNLDNFGGEPFLAGSDLLDSYNILSYTPEGGGGKK